MRLPVFLLLMLLCAPAFAVWEHTGQTPSGAVYRLAVPEGWRPGDGLVVYQRGLSFERDLDPDLGPLAAMQLEQGYAVAASGYSQSGWAVLASAQDNRELLERFRARMGEPGRVLTYGAAMGGHIALQMAEDTDLQIDGVLALCPSAAGDRLWQAALDLRLAYDAICAGVEGGELPRAIDHPWLLPEDHVSPVGLQDLVVRVNRCIGASVPAWLRSEAQQARLERLKSVTDIASDELLLLNLGHATLGLSDLVRDPGKLRGEIAVGNDGVSYGEDLDADVRRVEADRFAALDLRVRSNLTGAGDARIVSLHTQRDPVVLPGHQQWLRERIPATRLVSALVTEAVPSHCGFTTAEQRAAWETLHTWTARAAAAPPDAVELQARCLALTDDETAVGPCRIDAQAAPVALADAVRTRPAAVPRIDARFSGEWIDPAHTGERWRIEVLDEHSALVYALTFPAADEPGEQLWLLGTGRIDGDGVVVPSMYSMHGGRFGAEFAGEARPVPWGEVRLVFDACGSARLRYRTTATHGSGARDLVQTGHLGSQTCGAAASADAAAAHVDVSGSWYDDRTPGQGVVISAVADGTLSVAFLTYMPGLGLPVWLHGEGRMAAEDRATIRNVERPRQLSPERQYPDDAAWGELELEFDGCDSAILRYRSDDPAYGDGEIRLSRLTRPLGIGACGTTPAR